MLTRPLNSRVSHGDPTCADYGCRRPECLEARRRQQKRNKYLLASGHPGYVSHEKAHRHIQRFQAAGYSNLEILNMLGVANNSLYRILRGEQITRRIEARILAVPVPASAEENRAGTNVCSVGTQRRLKALMAMGWPSAELCRRAGGGPHWFFRILRRPRVRLNTSAAVTALYDDLWRQRPEDCGIPEEDAKRAREFAKRRGFAPPLAWDDDTIDDPAAVPILDAEAPAPSSDISAVDRYLNGESIVLDKDGRRKVIAHYMEWTNRPVENIAAELGIVPDSVTRSWERTKKAAREAGKPVPWRRVYIPLRELGLTSNEMEKAA